MFKFVRSVAVVVFLWSSVGSAQEAATSEQPLDPGQLLRLIQRNVAKSAAGSSLGGGGATLNAVGNVPLGWNTFHATHCQWITDGRNNFLYVLPSEGGQWFYANNIFAADTFLAGCVNGNFIAVHVINSASGDFDSILTYNYQ